MATVFMSYASADREQAKRLAEAMEARGYHVWWDRQIAPGQVFDEVIEKALSTASCVVVLWSSTSIKSDWVKTEASEAASRKILVPALIDNVKIPLEFRRLQAADLTRWDGGSNDLEFEKFLRAVDTEIQENQVPGTTPSNSPRSVDSTSAVAAKMAPVVEVPAQSPAAKPVMRSQPQPESATAEQQRAASTPHRTRSWLFRFALVAVAAAAVIAGFWFNNKSNRQTPNVLGMSYESAATALTAAGLQPERQERPSITDAPGTVIAQIPAAGMSIDGIAKVILTVAVSPAPPPAEADSSPVTAPAELTKPAGPAEPQATVPDLAGMNSERASELLSAAGLKLGVPNEVASNDVSLGTIISQDPAPTQTVAKNFQVNVTVAARRKVPELVGFDLQKAQAELTRLGLISRVDRVKASRGESDNHVVKQSPAPGQEIENGGETQLTIAITAPKNVSGGEGLFRTNGQRCVQVCKDVGLKWTGKWSGSSSTCACDF